MKAKSIIKALGIFIMIGSLVCMGKSYLIAQDDPMDSGTPPLSVQQDGEKGPEYAPGEVLVKFKEGVDPGMVLQEVGLEDQGIERIHSIKPTVAKFKKSLKEEGLERDSDGWYWFRGKQYKEVEDIADEEIFEAAYKQMSSEEKALHRSYKITLSEGMNVEEAVGKMQGNPGVKYAEPNYIMTAFVAPNDTFYSSQGAWGQDYEDLWNLHKIRCEEAWDSFSEDGSAGYETAGEGIVVAVIDTGVDYTHPELQNNIWLNDGEIAGNGIDEDGNGFIDDIHGYNFAYGDSNVMDKYGHGTHCAGTIAAEGNNSEGIIGVAPKAKIMVLKGLGDNGRGSTSALAECVIYAVDNGADVLSNSWGGWGASYLLRDVFHYAHRKGRVCTAASGNDYRFIQDDDTPVYPACIDTVIAVGASTELDVHADFANYGFFLDVIAPGGGYVNLNQGDDPNNARNIISTMSDSSGIAGTYPQLKIPNTSGYWRLSGTSMACPHVSGLAALLLSKYPKLNAEAARYIIRESADKLGYPGFNTMNGHGRIDAGAAMVHEGIYINKLVIDDSTTGNGNGNPEPGEQLSLLLTLISIGADMSDISATIASEDLYAVITNNTAQYGVIKSGEEGSNSFSISIDNEVPASYEIPFTLNITAQGGSYNGSYPFTVKVLVAENLVLVSGNNQSGFQESRLQEPLVVQLVGGEDEYPIANHRVTFELIEGSGILSDTEVSTDYLGRAQVYLNLGEVNQGARALIHIIKATAEGLENRPIEFTAFAHNIPINFKKVWDLDENYPDLFNGREHKVDGLAIGDIDDDGRKEIYMACFVYNPNGRTISIFEEDGDDSYTLVWHYESTGWYYAALAVGDIDRDGKEELVVGSGIGRIYAIDDVGNNDFEITQILDLYPRINKVRGIEIDDVGQLDNLPDLVICGASDNSSWDKHYLFVYSHYGTAGQHSYLKKYEYSGGSPSFGSEIIIGDADLDGNHEIIFELGHRGPTRIYRYEYDQGTGGFTKKVSEVVGNDIRPAELALGDFDSDGSDEIFAYGSIFVPPLGWREAFFNIEPSGDDSFYTDWQFDLDQAGHTLRKHDLEYLNNPAIFFAGGSTPGYCYIFSSLGGAYVPLAKMTFGAKKVPQIRVDDCDQDGKSDLVCGLGDGNMRVYENRISHPTTPVVTDEGDTTENIDRLYASWTCTDPESEIVEYKYMITQDSSTGTIIRNWTSTGVDTYVTAGSLSLAAGKTYYFGVKAKNAIGLWSEIGHSDGIKINRPPDISLIPDSLTKNEGETITPSEIELATDPDGDALTYTYSGWISSLPYEITYDNAGIHTLHVEVSDGEETLGKDITITVNNVNRPPDISLIPDSLTKNEGETIAPSEIELAQDPDGDTLTYTYSGWISSLPYDITYDDAGVHVLHVEVSDGKETLEKDISITVNNVELTPAAPSNLTLKLDSHYHVQLNWQDNSDNETSFKIYRRITLPVEELELWAYFDTVPADAISYLDATTQGGKAYRYYVVAVNDTGESTSSNRIRIKVPATPPRPSDLTLSLDRRSYVQLNWQDNSVNETKFKIYRRELTRRRQWRHIATVAENTTAYTDRRVRRGNSYRYYVTAVNSAGESRSSNRASITIPRRRR